MERLTTNKNVLDMGMYELAHNCCYIAEDGTGRYRDYEMDMDERDFTRNLMSALAGEDLLLEDESFDEEMMDNLMFDPFADVTGLIALFYRNMWAMADLRERLKRYEDAEEQGLLLRLPCKIGDALYRVNKDAKEPVIAMRALQVYVKQLHKDRTVIRIDAINDNDMDESCYFLEDIGKKVFLTRKEAENKLKEMEGNETQSCQEQ